VSAVPDRLFGRRCSLLVLRREAVVSNNPSAFVAGAAAGTPDALDLSDMHVTFQVRAIDVASPDNARIRVENLSGDTESLVQREYDRVVLQAGYRGAPFGVIFQGNIKQFAKGRTDQRTTYLDLLCADGDLAFNFAVISLTMRAGSAPWQRVGAVVEAFGNNPSAYVARGDVTVPGTGGTLPRGKVLFGLARTSMQQVAGDVGATWNISGGRINVTPLDSYLPGEAVVLTARTGLVGRPEQTEQGVAARCLINPRIRVGGLVRIDNASVNRTEPAAAFALPAGQLPFDRYVGVQMLADVTTDGLYRVYVVEHSGDNRGRDWYSDLILLAVDPVTGKVRT
jgi:hypothetical protein